MSNGRREFIKRTASTVGAAGTLSLLPGSIRRALAIPAASESKSIEDVQHIIVLMMENRSFDHYLGSHAGVRGFNDRTTFPIDGQASIWQQPNGNGGYVMPFHLDSQTTSAQALNSLPHGWPDGHAAWDSGRWDGWVPAKGALTMGHFERSDIPFHYALADSFTVCDSYFASCLGPTNPNRVHLMTGMLDVAGSAGGPLLSNSPPTSAGLTWTTYPQRLQQAGISWQIYQGVTGSEPFKTSPTIPTSGYGDLDNPDSPYNVMSLFPAITKAPAGSPLAEHAWSIRTYAQFTSDIAGGTLPQVSWLCPPALCSEHPWYHPADGATYIAAILDSLTANPAVWSKTALFIMYDENDGLFDHVVSPTPPDGAGTGLSNIDTTGEIYQGSSAYPAGPVGLGARVPMFVVSPWSKGAWTCSQVFDHTSVIRFMEKRFGVSEPNISAWRRAVSGDLMSAFDFENPNDAAIAVPSIAGLSAAADAQTSLPYPTVPTVQGQPRQEPGTRNARALPYELTVDAIDESSSSAVRLDFVNTGHVAAVLQVYLPKSVQASTRRYTVAAGTRLSDTFAWQTATTGSAAYELTVLGPNGFLRRFAASKPAVAKQNVTIAHEIHDGDLHLLLTNGGPTPCVFQLVDNRYGAHPQSVTVRAGETIPYRWSLVASHRWYDISVTSNLDSGFLRQFAGYVETGAPGVTDPSMA